MELWIGALSLGLLYAFMTMGVFITFRIHNFPDITVDGSFTSGAAVMAVLIAMGINPFLALGAAFIIGAVAGCATALINTRLNVNGLLAGILVMTGLYSINLHIMGRSNIPLLNQTTLFTYLSRLNPGLDGEIWTCIALCLVMLVFWLIVSLFFKTDLGIAMRSTGNNPTMAAANGVNVGRMTVFGVALANGLVGVSGGLVAQYQGFADIGMGIGTLLIGLAAVIIGESILKSPSMYVKVLSVLIGSMIFRLMIAIALFVGMNPIDLKLLTAGFVLVTLIISRMVAGKEKSRRGFFRKAVCFLKGSRVAYGLFATIIIIAVALFGYKKFFTTSGIPLKMHKIGVVQLTDNTLLNITRDSFVKEMGKIGYQDRQNCTIMLENANGDQPTVNSIIDKFLQEKADIVVTISTGCTQAAINKIKDRPLIFATVANPFIIGAGKSETDHVANVTGVYGSVPMDKTMEVVRKILPGKLTIGAIWDSAQVNAVFNAENLKKAAQAYNDVTFVGTTITSSAEVYEAALSLVQKGIDAFVLPPDNIVYSAFESVIKAAKAKNIPVFTSEVERLGDGALGVVGYDYTLSGIQAAHLVDRVLKGESPQNIPFERYRKLTVGINLEVAKALGISLSPDLLAQATIVHGRREAGKTKPKIGIIQFALEPNVELCKQGILKALAENGYRDKENIEIIFKNAQADFSLINSIIQDLLRRKVDIIIPLSTPCVQSAVQFAAGKKETKVVFTYIFDPYRIGAAKTPTDHVPNMTGVACFPPIEGMLDLMKEMFPDRKKVGIVWNSSEANSEAVLLKIRDQAAKIGLKVIEATVTSPAEVLEAARSLVNKGAQVFLNGGDNTVNVSFDSFVKVAQENKIPVFSVDSEFIEKGSFAVLGPDYFQTGYEGGKYVAKVLGGEDTANIPISQTKETLFMINLDIARKYGFKVDKALVKKAQKVVDSTIKPAAATTPGQKKRLALFLFSDHISLGETAKGVTDELEQRGILNKYNISVDTKNAQNEFYIAQSVARDIVGQKYDYIITLTTPALQAVANVNKKIPHIFGAVTDPYRAGVAENRENHLPNITGIATVEPVEQTIKFMRELFPDAKRIGIIWNPGEACSETCTYLARQAAKKYNFALLEATVSTTNEVTDALNSLLSKKIDLFLTSGDNTVILSLESIAGILKKHKIPYFTNASSDVTHGAFVSVGPDYYVIGKEIARLAERVIQGEEPKNIPIEDFAPDIISINLDLAKEYSFTIPPRSLQKAAKVFSGGKLVNLSETEAVSQKKAAPKKLALFLFSDSSILLEAARGVTEELARSGILQQHTITIDTKNSQNELYLAQSIAQDIVREKYDYIITLSTLALQVMANTNKKIPHIFGAVTDPYRMGVAKSSTAHLPNVTGVATFQPVETTIRVMRELFPQAKRIGIIWNPAEACSEACTYKARDAVKKYNFDLQEINVTSTSEVLDAMRSLLNRNIDLFLTSGDNTVIMALESVAATLKEHKIPYFTNTPSDVDRGAFVSIGADYNEVGKETARIAERVIEGENPANIPINNYVPEKIAVNVSLAGEYGIKIPETLLKKAAYFKR